jgi:mono/diheme cytochrome c family protein
MSWANSGAIWATLPRPMEDRSVMQKCKIPVMAALLAATALTLSPLPGHAADVDGAAVFKKKCASCHGADGKGDTKMGKKLSVKDLTSPEVNKDFDRDRMIKSTNEGIKDDKGKTVMKGFAGKLSDEEIAASVDHIIATFGAAAPAAHAE